MRLIYLDHIVASPPRTLSGASACTSKSLKAFHDKLRRMSPLNTKFLEEKTS